MKLNLNHEKSKVAALKYNYQLKLKDGKWQFR